MPLSSTFGCTAAQLRAVAVAFRRMGKPAILKHTFLSESVHKCATPIRAGVDEMEKMNGGAVEATNKGCCLFFAA